MAMPNLDPRTGGSCITCIAHKFVSIVIGWWQLVSSVLGFLILVFKPSIVAGIVGELDTGDIVIGALTYLAKTAFQVVLIIGLHKNKRLYVKTYCIFALVHLVLMILGCVVSLFLAPQNVFFIFFSLVIAVLFEVTVLFVVRSYYLLTYCNGSKSGATKPEASSGGQI